MLNWRRNLYLRRNMVKKTAKPANKKSVSPKKKSASAAKKSASPAKRSAGPAKKSVKKAAPVKKNEKPVKLRLDMLFSDPLKQAAKASARKMMK
jgi:hypothetical protein